MFYFFLSERGFCTGKKTRPTIRFKNLLKVTTRIYRIINVPDMFFSQPFGCRKLVRDKSIYKVKLVTRRHFIVLY
ncbi:MAG TPA: hypothetical protein HA230_01635 [Candidatus Aenigmarchaeota archaeon]|nr:hypothetical protein [Candidatus Aenigmarchaeota archaeon]